MTDKILELSNLCFEANKKILKNINWTVNNGQRWVLLGANGSGKTSLISTICGYNTPSSGKLEVCSKEYSKFDWQKIREKIAIVGNNLTRVISPSEIVTETIISGKFAMLNYWGKPSQTQINQAFDCMRQLGIEYLANQAWSYISQGERQKVLIARSLMLKPAIIFLDEPLNGLDPLSRKNFIKFLDVLAKDKSIPAIVIATHYVEEIPTSFNKAILLKDGEVLVSGDKKDVFNTRNFSKMYGCKCRLTTPKRGSYSLKIL